jgi:hypothetical protein
LADGVGINSGTIIANFYANLTACVIGTHPNPAFGRLSERRAQLRQFDAVIDGISQQMR